MNFQLSISEFNVNDDDRVPSTVVLRPPMLDVSCLPREDLEGALLLAEARIAKLTDERDALMHICARQVQEQTDLRRRLANADMEGFRYVGGPRRPAANEEGGIP